MNKNKYICSSFKKDLEARKKWNNLNSNQLWKLLFTEKILSSLKAPYPKNLKSIFFNQQIKHKGISKELYLRHPIRMNFFLKKYYPNQFSKVCLPVLFHNILEVSSFSKREIVNLLGENILSYTKILTINRKMQNNLDYLKIYYSQILKNKYCFLIKAIDKYDNLFDLKKNNNTDIKRNYIKEVETFLKPHLPKKKLFTSAFIENLNANKDKI